MLYKPDYIKSFLHNFPSSFGRCSVYRTHAVARVSGFVLYKELSPFKAFHPHLTKANQNLQEHTRYVARAEHAHEIKAGTAL